MNQNLKKLCIIAQLILKKNKLNLRFQELDSLRGLAAVMVVFFHFTMSRPEANLGFKVGVTGVDLFFIISGFVIFMSLKHIKKPIEFVINRFTRLFPTYWVCATFTYLIKTIFFNETVMSFKQYLVNLSMLQYYFKIDDLDGPYWTMIIELTFYFLMFTILIFNKIRNIVFICSVILILILINDVFFENYIQILETFIKLYHWSVIFHYFFLEFYFIKY